MAVKAGFDPSRAGSFHRLTLDVNAINYGRISVGPYASSQYPDGTVISLGPSPADGWEFDFWSGDLTGTNVTVTLIMDDDKQVTATFVPGPQAPVPPTALIRVAGEGVVIE